MECSKKRELDLMAAKIRKTALQTIQAAGSGHIGGSFSIADILSVLYFEKMNVDPMRPDDPDRDRLVRISWTGAFCCIGNGYVCKSQKEKISDFLYSWRR